MSIFCMIYLGGELKLEKTTDFEEEEMMLVLGLNNILFLKSMM